MVQVSARAVPERNVSNEAPLAKLEDFFTLKEQGEFGTASCAAPPRFSTD
jgi:hypothetical protein